MSFGNILNTSTPKEKEKEYLHFLGTIMARFKKCSVNLCELSGRDGHIRLNLVSAHFLIGRKDPECAESSG